MGSLSKSTMQQCVFFPHKTFAVQWGRKPEPGSVLRGISYQLLSHLMYYSHYTLLFFLNQSL